jgi:hypothetical protein
MGREDKKLLGGEGGNFERKEVRFLNFLSLFSDV